MAFRSIEEFNDDRYRYKFRLTKDGESADVIFLYRSKADMLIGPAHYIMSPEYNGYAECCGSGCPACARNIRKDTGKLFIPLYNLNTQKIEFWDRSQSFEYVMDRDVFDHYPNPSEYVFTVTRHGAYRGGDNNDKVTYSIRATYNNTLMTYDQILAKFHTTLDWSDYYQNICRTISVSDMERMLSSNNNSAAKNTGLSDYVATPRAGFVPTMPDTYVDASTLVSDNTPVESIPVTSDIDVSEDTASDGDTELPDPEF